MRKTSKIILITLVLAVILLGVGYAAVQNITLTISGTAKADVSQSNYEVGFTGNVEIEKSQDIVVNANVQEGSTSANINVSGFTSIGQTATVTYKIKNSSTNMLSALKVTTENDKPEYFTLSSSLGNTLLEADATTTAKVIIKLDKIPNESITSTIKVKIVATPVQPGVVPPTGSTGDYSQTPSVPNNGMYSVEEVVTPAPQELFIVEPIDATTARIKGMNNDYIEKNDETFYAVNHPEITDTLVIPYEVKIEDSWYTVTEVDLYVRKPEYDGTQIPGKTWTTDYVRSWLPSVDTIIYPNTVTTLTTSFSGIKEDNTESIGGVPNVQNVIFSDNITVIPDYFFYYYPDLTTVKLPSNLVAIGKYSFSGCTALTDIIIPSTVTSIGNYAFSNCSKLNIVSFEMTEVPNFEQYCFMRYNGGYSWTPVYEFKNRTVADAFISGVHYNSGEVRVWGETNE